jgi:3-hydroxybutyrate dehydrogenase
MIPEIIPSELPFSLDLIERCLFWVVSSYIWSTIASWIGFSFFVIFFTSILICCASVFVLDKIKVDPKGKAILITGCDTGFGNAIARKLHELGCTVFAGCISNESEGAKKLEKDFPERMHVIKMDITSESDVGNAMEKIGTKLTESNIDGLWAVICNAGWSTFGQVEWVPMDVYSKIMDINLFGTIRTVKGSLPLVRKAKGRIITVASMMGRFGASSRSPYCCTKWAVEGFTECLRLEMKFWGVKAICLEPGNFIAGTALFSGDAVKKQGEYMWNNLPQIVRDDYGKENFDNFIQKMSTYSSNGDTNIEPVLNAMCDSVLHMFPQTRYQIFSLHEKLKAFVSTHLPSIAFDYLYA